MNRGKTFAGCRLLLCLLSLVSALPCQAQLTQNLPAPTVLPDLGTSSRPASPGITINPKANAQSDGGSAEIAPDIGDKRLVLTPEYSVRTGGALGTQLALPVGNSAAFGLLFTYGAYKKELFANTGIDLDPNQRLILNLGVSRLKPEFDFLSGKERAEVTQYAQAASYRLDLPTSGGVIGGLRGLEFDAYRATAPATGLEQKSYVYDSTGSIAIDTRRIAAARLTGLQGRLVLSPLADSRVKLGLGSERLEVDQETGRTVNTRTTGSAEWAQSLANGYALTLGADAAATQDRYRIGLERSLNDGQSLTVSVASIKGRLGAQDDAQLRVSYALSFGGGKRGSGIAGGDGAGALRASLLDQVGIRPAFIPAQGVAKRDAAAAPVLNDSTPNNLAATLLSTDDPNNAPVNTVFVWDIRVTGINAPVQATVSGAGSPSITIRRNGTAIGGSTAINGDVVRVEHVSAGTNVTTRTSTVTIGGKSVTVSTTTEP